MLIILPPRYLLTYSWDLTRDNLTINKQTNGEEICLGPNPRRSEHTGSRCIAHSKQIIIDLSLVVLRVITLEAVICPVST